jgi:death-on-curing protein
VKPTFLGLDEVLAIHGTRLRLYGGHPGLRDLGLLQSALAMPRQVFAGRYLHGTIHEMAAAYLFHICQDHPFVDGNKRAALAVAGVFLWLNGFSLTAEEDALTELVLGVARGDVTKAQVAVYLQSHTAER